MCVCAAKALVRVFIHRMYGYFEANLKNIFVSPYPTLFLWYGSVGRKKIFFLTSQIPYPLNLIVIVLI